GVGTAGGEFVMRALSRQEWPRTAQTSAVEGAAVFVFAIPIAVVSVPARALRKLGTQKIVHHLDSVYHAGVVRCPQTEANKRQRIRTNDLAGARRALIGSPVFDGDEALQGRRGAAVIEVRRDADLVAFHAHLTRQIATHGVGPALNVVVPTVCR